MPLSLRLLLMLKYNDLVYHKVFHQVFKVITPQTLKTAKTILIAGINGKHALPMDSYLINLKPLKDKLGVQVKHIERIT